MCENQRRHHFNSVGRLLFGWPNCLFYWLLSASLIAHPIRTQYYERQQAVRLKCGKNRDAEEQRDGQAHLFIQIVFSLRTHSLHWNLWFYCFRIVEHFNQNQRQTKSQKPFVTSLCTHSTSPSLPLILSSFSPVISLLVYRDCFAFQINEQVSVSDSITSELLASRRSIPKSYGDSNKNENN